MVQTGTAECREPWVGATECEQFDGDYGWTGRSHEQALWIVVKLVGLQVGITEDG